MAGSKFTLNLSLMASAYVWGISGSNPVAAKARQASSTTSSPFGPSSVSGTLATRLTRKSRRSRLLKALSLLINLIAFLPRRSIWACLIFFRKYCAVASWSGDRDLLGPLEFGPVLYCLWYGFETLGEIGTLVGSCVGDRPSWPDNGTWSTRSDRSASLSDAARLRVGAGVSIWLSSDSDRSFCCSTPGRRLAGLSLEALSASPARSAEFRSILSSARLGVGAVLGWWASRLEVGASEDSSCNAARLWVGAELLAAWPKVSASGTGVAAWPEVGAGAARSDVGACILGATRLEVGAAARLEVGAEELDPPEPSSRAGIGCTRPLSSTLLFTPLSPTTLTLSTTWSNISSPSTSLFSTSKPSGTGMSTTSLSSGLWLANLGAPIHWSTGLPVKPYILSSTLTSFDTTTFFVFKLYTKRASLYSSALPNVNPGRPRGTSLPSVRGLGILLTHATPQVTIFVRSGFWPVRISRGVLYLFDGSSLNRDVITRLCI